MGTSFTGGPAGGQVLMLRRSPQLLRVVWSPLKCDWDALDQVDDTPAADEEVHVYLRDGQPFVAMVDWADKRGRRCGGRFSFATYIHAPLQPPEPIARDNRRWQEWCVNNIRRVLAALPERTPS